MKYWLCVTDEENWRVIRERRVWGVPRGRKAIMDRVRPGDVLVFYVKPKRIGGIFRVTSEPFRSSERVFKSTQYGGPETFPHRVRIKPVAVPGEPVPFDPLIPRLSFTRGRRWWTAPLRRGMFEIPRGDYEAVERLLKRRVRKK